MISYIEKLSPQDVARLPNGSIKTRILAMYSGYGTSFDFLDFWLQKEGEKITAAICRFEGAAWLLASEDANWEELSSFLKVIAPTLLADAKTAESLGLTPFESFFEVSKEAAEGQSDTKTPPIMQIYDMLMSGADGDIEIPNKTEWYADISHRFRHETAKAAATKNAVALAGFVAEDSALITGVATDSSQRSKGEGKAVLDELLKALCPRIVYAEATEKAVGFYIKCGFSHSAVLVRCRT